MKAKAFIGMVLSLVLALPAGITLQRWGGAQRAFQARLSLLGSLCWWD